MSRIEFNQKYVVLTLQADWLGVINVVVLRMLKRIFDIFPVAVDFLAPNLMSVEMDLRFLHFYKNMHKMPTTVTEQCQYLKLSNLNLCMKTK